MQPFPQRVSCSTRHRVAPSRADMGGEEIVPDGHLRQTSDEFAEAKRERLRNALGRSDEDLAAGRMIQLENEELFASL